MKHPSVELQNVNPGKLEKGENPAENRVQRCLSTEGGMPGPSNYICVKLQVRLSKGSMNLGPSAAVAAQVPPDRDGGSMPPSS
jgi:hypothetical protein